MRRVFKNYYLIRLLKAFLTIFIVTTLTFFLIRLMPGNPLDIYISQQVAQGTPYQDAVQMANSIFQVDLNQPVYVQYLAYMKNLLHGDFGVSIISAATPVIDIVMRFLPWTLFVVTISLFVSFLLGVLFGTLMAYKRNSWVDHVLSSFASIITAVPNYVTAMLIVVIFGVTLNWFDTGSIRGSMSPGVQPEFSLDFLLDALYHASLPIITYILTTIGTWMLMMKSNTVSTLGEDYVNVARARGLSDARITTAYVGRNAVLPLFTTLAISIGFVVGGSTLIESIFQYAGIGLKLSAALTSRDYPVIQAIFIIICASVVLANVLADLLYSLLDPRIRAEGR
ncbi:MAG TPA: ABC transporter permease [Symbiobacteriaceae bacterium]|nr:ABC transporter permease [Symbiobacteriaceae bacterium]